METASYTAKRIGLPVTVLPYMHEISWGGPGIPEHGHPWTLSEWMIDREGFDFFVSSWRNHPFYAENAATRFFDMISSQIDDFLLARGYRHEGCRFFCSGGTDETIALFSHGGSGACVLAHLLSLPFPYVATVLPYEFTSISILEFPVRQGMHVHPRIELFNDTAHIRNFGHALVFQKDSE